MINANSQVDRNQDGKIQYVLLEGEAGHQDAIIRTDCSVKTLIGQGIELEKLSYQFADWNRAQAENKMTQLLGQYGDKIELVLANNDEMANLAVDLYKENPLTHYKFQDSKYIILTYQKVDSSNILDYLEE